MEPIMPNISVSLSEEAYDVWKGMTKGMRSRTVSQFLEARSLNIQRAASSFEMFKMAEPYQTTTAAMVREHNQKLVESLRAMRRQLAEMGDEESIAMLAESEGSD
jgi:hypothetical protein